jgi:hypothetical protein
MSLRLCFFSLCLIAATIGARGQGNLGGLTGYISDPTGAAIADASLTLTNLDTGAAFSVLSTTEGVYRVGALPPGRYRVAVTKPGFKTFQKEPVIVTTETVSNLDVSMTVGDVTQSVIVTGGDIQLQTASAEVGTVMERQAILDLPISLGGSLTTGASGRRQIESFAFLTPGVTGNQWEKSINGAPGFSQEILYDGVDAQNIGAPGFIAESTPPYEAVQEFKVQNTLFPAEYGMGYGVLNFTLRSGTNQFHGDLFEFVRNNNFDARGFFSSYKPVIQQNEYGGTIGGPVILPKIYNGKDKTFFFFAYSGFQLRGGLPPAGLLTLPSTQERTGDFSDYPYPIYDPATTRPDGNGGFTRDPFPGNKIPQDRISAVAQRTIPLIPTPSFPGYFNNYIDHSYQPTSENTWSVKIDHAINSKQRLSGSYWWTNADTTIHGSVAGQLDNSLRHTPSVGGGVRVNYDYTIRPTVLNHIGFGYTPNKPTWSVWLVDPREGNKILQIPGIPQDVHGFPYINFNAGSSAYSNGGNSTAFYAPLGNAPFQGYDPQYYQNWALVEDLSWVTGRHQLKFGVQYRRRKITAGDFTNAAGTFSFDGHSTSLPDSPNFDTWGNAFASFMLGQVFSANRNIPAPINHFHDTFWSFYADDVMKVTRKMTLTLGLRYELPSLATEEQGIVSLLNTSLPNPGAGGRPGALEFLGNGTGRTGTFNIFGPNYRKAFAPRAGLAYSLNGKTVARLGYGVFYIYPNYGRLGGGGCFLGWCQGFGALPSFSSTNTGITPAFLLDSGFPASNFTVPDFDPAIANNGLAPYINPSSNRPSMNQSWTVDIQRQLPAGIMVDAAYVGSRTTGLWTGLENINQVNPSYLSLGNTLYADISSPQAAAAGVSSPYPGFQGSVAQALRPFPQYSTIYDMFQPTGYLGYHSLQIRVQKRYSQGLSFLGSYTLSKAIGNFGSDTFGDVAGGGGAFALDTFNRNLEKALSPVDQTHVFVFSWTYEFPFGKGKRFLSNTNLITNAILGGWQMNSIETYHSGTPIAVGGGSNLPLFGGGNRPNWISSNVRTSVSMSNFDPATSVYLNINAFSEPAAFTIGNAPARLPSVRTPAFYNEDFSVFKKFGLWTESRYLEFRAEFFNLPNRVVFGGPSANVNSPSTFGTIGSQANTPRVIQFAMKLVF